jgi:hypothetical protein
VSKWSPGDPVPEGFRVCGFCHCLTNAKLRACCDAGRGEDWPQYASADFGVLHFRGQPIIYEKPVRRSWWVSCRAWTVRVDTEGSPPVIRSAAPICRWAIGKTLNALIDYAQRKFRDVTWVELR